MKPKWSNYNDGKMGLYHETAQALPFSTAEATAQEAYQTVHFARASVRAQDVEYAEQIGISFSMKVRCRNVDECVVGDNAIFGGKAYNIQSIDRSNDMREMYLYLEYAREA